MKPTKHVLIAEDEPSLQTAIRLTLEAAGFSVSAAGDGLQALETLESTSPDIIIADIMMPRMDGYELYQAIRARSKWTSIPFIFLTARADKEDAIKGKALGAEDYLTKPVDPTELLTTIRARLARAQAVKESAQDELDEIKRQIVTMLSHEMRTPLTYIKGYTELALDDIAGTSPEMLQEFLEAIGQGAERLKRMSNDLLLLTRADTGLLAEEIGELSKPCHDLDAVVKRAVNRHQKQAAAKGLNLELHVPPDVPPVELCEPLFETALRRLVDNGIRFTKEEGKAVTVSIQASEGWVKIAVADQGVGVPPGAISDVFARFQQIDRETQEQQGIGLGLTIAQEIVRLHGGEIKVESTASQGSTFTIKLPVAGEGSDSSSG
jgi:signal transduction histidine kinase